MSRRIQIELTSARPDGDWTWRAAGAREPKGVLPAGLLNFAVSTGDELTVEADFHIDGIEIIEVFPPKERRTLPETLEVLGSGSDGPLVTTQLVPGRKRRDGEDGRDRRDKRRRDGRDGDRSRQRDRNGDRRDRRDRGDRQDRDRDRSERRDRDREEERPRFKRLRPERTHRTALIESLPEEQKPVAEQILRDGVDKVAQSLEDSKKAKPKKSDKAEPKPQAQKPDTGDTKSSDAKPTDPEPKKPSKADAEAEFAAVARSLLPRLRAAEWQDRAEAALAGVDEIDLRDLRQVVGAATGGASDDKAKELAQELRTKLTERVDREHAEWLAEIAATLAEGRVVRALNRSSRPPKAGAPLPQDMATRLTESANAALTNETPPGRWVTVLKAVAFSPVRRTVQPQGVPAEPGEELLSEVRRLADRLPEIAAMFGVEAAPAKPRNRRTGRPRTGEPSGTKPQPPKPEQAADKVSEPDSEPADTATAPEAEPVTETAPESEPAEAADKEPEPETAEPEPSPTAESGDDAVAAEEVQEPVDEVPLP